MQKTGIDIGLSNNIKKAPLLIGRETSGSGAFSVIKPVVVDELCSTAYAAQCVYTINLKPNIMTQKMNTQTKQAHSVHCGSGQDPPWPGVKPNINGGFINIKSIKQNHEKT